MFVALRLYTFVMPAQAGIQVVLVEDWIPAFAGMTAGNNCSRLQADSA